MISDHFKYKRLLTFGCSFTRHLYPSWPNVILQDLPNATLYNFGVSGAGNLHIACRIAEANLTYNFCETDLVIVMWSSFIREDRFIKNEWRTHGNVYHNSLYDRNFCEKYVDPLGFLIRDCSLIQLTKDMLKNSIFDSIMLKSYPFMYSESLIEKDYETELDIFLKTKQKYKKLFDDMPPSLCETIYPNFPKGSDTWYQYGHSYLKQDNTFFKDPHPNPYTYYEYLQKIGFNLSEKAEQYAISETESLKTLTKEIEIKEKYDLLVKENNVRCNKMI